MTTPAPNDQTDRNCLLAGLLELCRASRSEEAEALYRTQAAAPPPDAPGLICLAEAARTLGHPADAISWLGAALRAVAALPPAAPRQAIEAEAQAVLALALVAAGRIDEAAAAAQQALRQMQDGAGGVATVQALRAMALVHLRHSRLGEAETACTEAFRVVDAMAVAGPQGPMPVSQPPVRQMRAELFGTLALVRMLEGRLEEADALFRRALAEPPVLPDLQGNHAALLVRLGRHDEALELAEQAVERRPRLTGTLHLIGSLHHRAGRFEAAIAAFHRVLGLVPDHADARLLLADSLRGAGHWQEAATVCRDGLAGKASPDGTARAALLANLGAALHSGGETAGALEAYQEALRLRPDLPEVHNNLARLYKDAGDPDAAIEQLVQATGGRPLPLPLQLSRLALLIQAGRSAEADAAAFAIVRTAPDDAELCFRVASLFLQGGWRLRSVPYIRKAIQLAPDTPRHWIAFGDALRDLVLPAVDTGLRRDLLAALARPEVEVSALSRAIAAALLSPASAPLARLAALPLDDSGTSTTLDAASRTMLVDGSLAGLAEDALLLTHLQRAPVCDPALERALTRLRRTLLLALTGPGLPDQPAWTRVGAALAAQCFLNEYAFAETGGELQVLAAVVRKADAMLQSGEQPPAMMVALIGAYRPLHSWERAAGLPGLAWPEEIVRLLARQLVEPAAEAAIEAELPALTPIRNAVSAAVRAQYEENPYPRWLTTGLLPEPVALSQFLHTLFPHAALPAPTAWDRPGWEAPEVLVAGCGTGREAVWAAATVRNARVLAVDLSRRSLAYAARQSQRLGLKNITFAQADLLELATLDRRFDVIHSVGVLHHMEDPMAGLRILRGMLRPQGVMELGFYSAAARRPVVAARRFILEQGYPPTAAGIRRLRQDILALPDEHPARLLVRSPDFYGISSCRDLLLHVHELHATLPWLTDALAALDLEFLGFRLADPAVAALYRKRFPDDPAMTSLARWDRLEAEHPMIFGGLYQAWVRAKG